MNKCNSTFKRQVFQSGFSLIELIISLGIGLFLLTGIAVIFLSNRATFKTQGQLATLLNNEIMAMNIIGNVVQSAGYYTNPQTTTTSSALPPGSVTTTNSPIAIDYGPSQAVFGGTVNSSDSISVRAMQNNSLGAIDCTGNNTGTHLISSTFSLDANNNLQCTTWDMTATTYNVSQTLVSGVSSMAFLYGVVVDPGPTPPATQQYVAAANVPNWSKVMSVRVTLNFVNPMASQAGQPATLAFTKVIGIMGQL